MVVVVVVVVVVVEQEQEQRCIVPTVAWRAIIATI
jgi:hypothetical protein